MTLFSMYEDKLIRLTDEPADDIIENLPSALESFQVLQAQLKK